MPRHEVKIEMNHIYSLAVEAKTPLEAQSIALSLVPSIEPEHTSMVVVVDKGVN